MRLVIHDLGEKEWNRIQSEYKGDRVVSDSGSIHPCIGCFSCWNKTPGRCVIRDGYESMGELIHHADEVIVISHYTYGGFSGFVKNVFDRSLGYVLPQFEVVNGESHHRKRYEETRLFTFIFLGHNLSTEEKDSAVRYVNAVIANIRGQVKSVEFRECEEQDFAAKQQTVTKPGRTVLLIGSMRSERGNSAKLAAELNSLMDSEAEILPIKDHLGKTNELCSALESAEKIVLCTPLYVDGLPAQVIRFMEDAEKHLSRIPRKVYVLANMGLYESSQMVNLFGTVKQWCGKMNQDYCGGLGISAGELIGTLMDFIPFRHGPSRNASAGMKKLSDAVRRGTGLEVISAEPFCFPRFLYIMIANLNWNRTARINGIKPADLYRRL